METKTIYSRKMAVFLRNNGCKIIRAESNPYQPEFDIWIFEDNDILQHYIAEFMNHKK